MCIRDRLDGVDTLVLLAGGYVFLVDEIQQVVVYLAGSNRFNLTLNLSQTLLLASKAECCSDLNYLLQLNYNIRL